MEYEDRVTIATPEGVEVHLALAGLGSRFVAALIDGIIKWLVVMAIFLITMDSNAPWATSDPSDLGWAAAVGFVLIFLINFFYDVLFEVQGSGRTPGKRWTGLRVVREGGQPVDAKSSSIRNILRIVDGLPVAYLVGIIAIVATQKNQRIGDLAGGTLVVREARRTAARSPTPRAATRVLETATAQAWDVSAVTQQEIQTVRSFLDRRHDIDIEARKRLAWDLAARLRPKVGGAPTEQHPEDFLELLVQTKPI